MSEDAICIEPRKPEMKIHRRLVAGRQFGEGGMSLLLDAVDTNLMRKVAMKVLRESVEKDEDELGRMVVEAQITAQLDHPNIVPIYELGLDKKKRLFFTMKKVLGKPLYELINEKELHKRTDKDIFFLIQVMLKVCNAVAYAHSKGVLHRDLKPDNIMVGSYGQVYLMDWGVAYLKEDAEQYCSDTDTSEVKKRKRFNFREEKKGSVVGTPCYMPPEQANGDLAAIDERSDIFTIGAILYEILTGEFPFPGKSLQEMTDKAKKCEFQSPNERVDFPLPVGLVRITMKAMSPEPADRYQTVKELRSDLESFLEGNERFPGRSYRAGDLIVREGEQGDEAYIIKAGECLAFKTIDGDRVELRTMGVGDVFGETAILTDGPRSASVEALTNVTVAVIKGRHFEEELGTSTWIAPFIRTLAERFREADEKVNG